jgi:acyl carrier protein
MTPNPQEIESAILEIVKDMTADWDLELDQLGAESALVEELCFSSVDFLHLMAAVEMRFGKKLSFESLLIQNGAYRTELKVGELAGFVAENFDREQVDPVSA